MQDKEYHKEHKMELKVKQKQPVKWVKLAVLFRYRSLVNRLFLSIAVSIANILKVKH